MRGDVPELTDEQVASLTASQTARYDSEHPDARRVIGWAFLWKNAENRRLRQGERKRQLQAGEITRGDFGRAVAADPVPPGLRGPAQYLQPKPK